MGRLIMVLILIVSLTFEAQSQRASYFRRVFVDAEFYLLYEEYRDALPLYQELLDAYPENSNIHYRIGQCYLNIPHQKSRAISFLETAITDITENYREGFFSEEQAPRESYLLLGQAYRIQNEFQKAKHAIDTYKRMVDEDENEELMAANKELEALVFAQEMMENPIEVNFQNLGRQVNTRFSDVNPLVSEDEKTVIYTSEQQFYNAIMMSSHDGKSWKHPFNLNSQLMADGTIHAVGISADARTMILARNDNDIYNLYISHFDTISNLWEPMSRLPREINSRSWETHGSLSPNGDTLFFASNRPGGFGGYDIYMSVKNESGWSSAINLGETINTSFDEIAPVMTHDGRRLVFASEGHATMGGFDILMTAVNTEGSWSKPLNVGYPINNTDDVTFFFPIGAGTDGYISRFLPQSHGLDDLYRVNYDPNDPEEELQEDSNGDNTIPIPYTQGELSPQASLSRELFFEITLSE